MADFIAAAIRYVDHGFGVLPVDGKKGFLEGGWKAAAHDAFAAELLFHNHPGKNIALVLPPTLCVIDLDPRNGSDDTLLAWEDAHGPLPETVQSRTGGGGKHLYFRCVEGRKLRKTLGPGIDLLAPGKGQVTEWPSVTAEPYEWISAPWEFPYADLPDQCYAPPEAERPAPKTNGHGSHQPDDSIRKYCWTALANEKQRLATTLKGGRNAALNNAALALGHLAHYHAFNVDEARIALRNACQDNGLIGDDGQQAFETTFASGWAKGESEPASVEPATPKSRHPAPQAATEPRPAKPDEEWKNDLVRTGRSYAGTESNIEIALTRSPQFTGKIAFDIRKWRAVQLADTPAGPKGDWSDGHTARATIWLQREGFNAKFRTVDTALIAVSQANRIDPLADWLVGLEWDGTERIERWLATYCQAEDTEANRMMGSKWLIGAVARALRPGCRMDNMLVLEGPQGARKSTLVKVLGGEFSAENLPDFHSKDAMLIAGTAWLIEVSELAATKKSETESIRSFITRLEDTFRPPYGRYPVTQKRRCVLIGNMNPDGTGYLLDPTGNRRFWPVPVKAIDIEAVKRDREQLWAEAVHYFNRGDPWHISQDQQTQLDPEQHARVVEDPWEPPVRTWADAQLSPFTTVELAKGALDMKAENVSRAVSTRIGIILKKAGFLKKRQREDTSLSWVYFRL